MENSSHNSKKILIVVVIVIAIAAIWYSTTRETGHRLSGIDPVITIQSPNGRENIEIGSRVAVTIDVAGEPVLNRYVVLSLEPGAAPLALFTSTTSNILLDIPESILIGGDAMAPLEPGKYLLRATLYDGMPCLGHCMSASSTEIGFDVTDSEINIIRAATSTAPVATSTATTTTN